MSANITSSSSFFSHPNHNPIKKTSKPVLMLANKDSPNTSSSSLIRVGSSIKIKKVFEDKSRGIVCYMDDNGEITCEGFDEGPRLHQGSSRFSCYPRGKQDIVDLLERSLLQVTDGGKLN
ncbi:hypothetical protein HanXRQr2_Chr10g0458481 [Helianthus annuus]|uniref:Uncharacterized protein n=1 Tax=Helianthus annuus TaxID=4232 RepID=A0A251TNF1_HELAN|nr:uncharacterized protein LOC110886442 [Helianthus annuus]KAF5787940.1 hypothetical protein HanXRQr2_Chr10g0458481 [Helianthus annuus]